MRSLTGTWPLLRLALRRDRVKLSLWIVAVAGLMATQVPGVIDFYGKSYQDQVLYATTTAPSVVGRVFGGPVHGPEVGSIVMNETFLFTAIAAAFMSTLAIVRHTRQNEETGRSELIGSAIVGHHASLTAALLITVGANIILGGLLALAFMANNLPTAGSIGAGAAIAATGIVFAALAAIAAQLSGTTRGANSLSAIIIGVAFLLRAAGDGMGSLVNGGLGVASAWPSWLSPIGWGQQMYPFSEDNWWIFGLFGALFVVVITGAYALNAHRDLGLGMLPDRRGPVHAKRQLLSPLGLAWRLQRGVLIGWAITVVVMGGIIGIISEEFKNLFQDNPQVAEIFGQTETGISFTDFFFAAMMGLMSIALAGYVVQALLRMRSEESAGHLEPVLATHVSRWRWMMSHVSWVLAGTISLLVLLGVSAGVTYVLITGAEWSETLKITKAALVYVPALLTFIGFVVAVFGLIPRFSIAIAWTSFALTYLMAQFGVVLKLPQTLLNVSPFAHIPAVPLENIVWTPIFVLSAIALGLAGMGFVSFRRRNISTT